MVPIVVSGVGALTPVGANAAQTCASVRAGLSGLRRHPEYIARLPPVVMEPPGTIACGFALEPDRARRDDRMLRLAVAAMRDLVYSARLSRAELEGTAVVVCLGGADLAPLAEGVTQEFSRELIRRLGFTPRQPPRAFSGSAASVFEAVGEARQALLERRLDRVLVLAVDCLIDRASLKWLDQHDRLQSKRNPDGFIPGEAACCFLLELADVASARQARVLASLVDVGVGREQNGFTTELNSSGQGLSAAIRGAVSSWTEEPIGLVISDMNGESYWGYEWGLIFVRLGHLLGASELWHPADSTGGIGVAAPALAVILASTALARGYAPSSRAVLLGGSDGEARAACTLQAAGAPPAGR